MPVMARVSNSSFHAILYYAKPILALKIFIDSDE
jgi:hypothetical protein